MAPPIVKMMPISSRPLRYDKCHLKEGDTLFTLYKEGVGLKNNPEQLPSRVVMNNRSLGVFTNENLDTELATFILESTTFKLSERPNCFVLSTGTIKG